MAWNQMMRRTFGATLMTGLLALVATGPASGLASAQSAAEFYRGKQLTMFVAFTTGGGYDTYARFLARHIHRHVPGDPKTVVQNMPGAGGLTLTNHLYSVAAKDGTVIGTIEPGSAFEPLWENPAAQFDATKFVWIGGMNSEVSTCQAWHTSPVKSLEQARETVMIVGGTGSSDGNYIYPKVLNEFAGTKFKLVAGYPGTNEIFLAMERGEVHGICGWFWSSILSRRADWLSSQKIVPLVQLALEKHPNFPQVPLALDMARTDEDRKALELILAPTKMGRPYIAPPGLPADRIAALRQAFADTMKDPGFVADAKKVDIELNPTTGEELAAIVERIYATPKALVQRAAQARK